MKVLPRKAFKSQVETCIIWIFPHALVLIRKVKDILWNLCGETISIMGNKNETAIDQAYWSVDSVLGDILNCYAILENIVIRILLVSNGVEVIWIRDEANSVCLTTDMTRIREPCLGFCFFLVEILFILDACKTKNFNWLVQVTPLGFLPLLIIH